MRKIVGKFRNRIQRKLCRDLNCLGRNATQEEFDAYKERAVRMRPIADYWKQYPKVGIIDQLMISPEKYGLNMMDIADISGIPMRVARKFAWIDIFKMSQLAEFSGGFDPQLFRLRGYGKECGKTMEELFQTYNIPSLHKITEGLEAMHIDISRVPHDLLDALAASRLTLLDLIRYNHNIPEVKEVRSGLQLGYRTRAGVKHREDMRIAEELTRHIQEIPFGNGEYVLVHRDKSKAFY